MAKKNTFLLVSLSETQTKDLAQAISNDTCRKILDYLAEREGTESEIAKNLGLPMSTVHYNLSQLQKGGLVDVDEFHYSPKGKEVNHYKLANKYIIIAPRAVSGLKEKLKSILPTVGIVGGLALALRFAQERLFTPTFRPDLDSLAYNHVIVQESAGIIAPSAEPMASAAMKTAAPLAADAGNAAMEEASRTMADVASDHIVEAAPRMAPHMIESAQDTVAMPMMQYLPPAATEPSIWMQPTTWFVLGAVLAIVTYILIEYYRTTRRE